jgi:hypothetical protein
MLSADLIYILFKIGISILGEKGKVILGHKHVRKPCSEHSNGKKKKKKMLM